MMPKSIPALGRGDLRQKARALGRDSAYVALQRIPSHAVHGAWGDLITNHLRTANGGFTPDNSWRAIDPRLLCPLAILVLEAVEAYFARYLADVAEIVQVKDRIGDLIDRAFSVEAWHEELLSQASEACVASGAVEF